MRAGPPSPIRFLLSLALGGCAPVVNIEGSFFPAWLLALLLGIGLTAALRPLFARTGLEPHMGPLLLVYPSLCLFLTFGIWLVLYRG
jgi:hypothetical protein